MKKKGLKSVKLEEKEGIALINGTQFMSSIVSEAEVKSRLVIESATIVFAFAVEIFGFDRNFFSNSTI